MDYGFYEEYGTPFSGRKLRKLRDFLQAAELDYDEQIEYTVNLTDGDKTKNVFFRQFSDDPFITFDLGGRVIDSKKAVTLADIFVKTEFDGGRHQKRVAMLE